MTRPIGPEPLIYPVGRVSAYLIYCLVGAILLVILEATVERHLGVNIGSSGSIWLISVVTTAMSVIAIFWRKERRVSAVAFGVLILISISLMWWWAVSRPGLQS